MTTVSLHRPEDLLTLLPYRMGYHPHRSVVVATLVGKQLGPIARGDAAPREHAAQAARAMVTPLLRVDPSALVVVGYESCAGECEPLLREVAAQAGEAGVTTRQVLVVHEGRWRSLDCTCECCADGGKALPAASDVPAIAAYVLAGCAPLANRDEVRQRLVPHPPRAALVGAELRALPACEEVERRRAELWCRALDVGADLEAAQEWPDRELALLVASLRSVHWRDAVISVLAGGIWDDILDESVWDEADQLEDRAQRLRGRLEGDDFDSVGRQFLDRLLSLCRLVPDDLATDAAAICAVAAALSWELGDGTLAREAAERALRADPDYRLAGLLVRMLDLGVPPTRLAGNGSL